MTMGAAGHVLYRLRVTLRVIVIVIAGLLVALVQPINVGSVIWASVIVLILLLALELLQRPPVAAAKTSTPASTKPVAGVAKVPAKRASTAKRATATKRATSARK
jgi:hypothetical protein